MRIGSAFPSDAYGDETDEWAGKPLVLYEAVVEFQGRRVPAIRVRVPAPSKRAADFVPSAPVPNKPEGSDHGLDDEIPF